MRGIVVVVLALIAMLAIGEAGLAGAMGQAEPLIVVSGDNPGDYVASPDSTFNGVLRVQVGYADADGNFIGGLVGTGSLLWSGRHILTAAHLFKPVGPFWEDKTAVRSRIFFNTPSGASSVWAASWDVYPGFDTSGPAGILVGGDLAVIELPGLAPADATRYQLYQGAGEVGAAHTKAGIGRSGTGKTGMPLPVGTLRSGQNIYDTVMDPILEAPGFWGPGTLVPGVDFIPGSLLSYDFDSGAAANDMHGYVDGYFLTPGNYPGWTHQADWHDTGLGLAEICGAPGDSGGPTFIDGKIAGVTSLSWWWVSGVTDTGVPIGGGPDWDTIAGNRSWGEAGADTRVTMFDAWIRSNVPEPATVTFLAFALPVLAGAAWRRRRRGNRS